MASAQSTLPLLVIISFIIPQKLGTMRGRGLFVLFLRPESQSQRLVSRALQTAEGWQISTIAASVRGGTHKRERRLSDHQRQRQAPPRASLAHGTTPWPQA